MTRRIRLAACTAVPAALGLGGSAHAAGLDCAKPPSSVARLICRDPALGAREAILARLFVAARTKDPDGRIQAAQRRWLAELRACGDAACVRTRYDARIDTLMRTEGGARLGTSFFTRGSNGNDGTLLVYGPVRTFAAVSITATVTGPAGAEAGDVNADGTGGVIDLRDGRGRTNRDGCAVVYRRIDPARWQVEQHGRCALASGVTFAGIYRR